MCSDRSTNCLVGILIRLAAVTGGTFPMSDSQVHGDRHTDVNVVRKQINVYETALRQ